METVETHSLVTSMVRAAELSGKLNAFFGCRAHSQLQELGPANARLTDELERAKTDMQDINEFLTNQLKGSALKIAGLETRSKELETKLSFQEKAHQVKSISEALDTLSTFSHARLVGAWNRQSCRCSVHPLLASPIPSHKLSCCCHRQPSSM